VALAAREGMSFLRSSSPKWTFLCRLRSRSRASRVAWQLGRGACRRRRDGTESDPLGGTSYAGGPRFAHRCSDDRRVRSPAFLWRRACGPRSDGRHRSSARPYVRHAARGRSSAHERWPARRRRAVVVEFSRTRDTAPPRRTNRSGLASVGGVLERRAPARDSGRTGHPRRVGRQRSARDSPSPSRPPQRFRERQPADADRQRPSLLGGRSHDPRRHVRRRRRGRRALGHREWCSHVDAPRRQSLVKQRRLATPRRTDGRAPLCRARRRRHRQDDRRNARPRRSLVFSVAGRRTNRGDQRWLWSPDPKDLDHRRRERRRFKRLCEPPPRLARAFRR